MKIITAPDKGCPDDRYYSVFLAGGITGCTNWQEQVISELIHLSDYYNLQNVAIFNPRRDEFDVTDSSAEIEQIKWEHERLKRCDIFSCFFAANKSLHPITLYEMGKWSTKKPSVITVQKGYLRERDVLIQTALDKLQVSYISGEEAIKHHAMMIASKIQEVKGR